MASATVIRCLRPFGLFVGLLAAAACGRSAPSPAVDASLTPDVASASEALSLFECPWGPGECTWTDPAAPAKPLFGMVVRDSVTRHQEVAARFVAQGTGFIPKVALRIQRPSASVGSLVVELREDGKSPIDGRVLAFGRVSAASICARQAATDCSADALLQWVNLDLLAPRTGIVTGKGYWLRLYGEQTTAGDFEASVSIVSSDEGGMPSGVASAVASTRTVTCDPEPKNNKKPVCLAAKYARAESFAGVSGQTDLEFLPLVTVAPAPSCFDAIRNGGEPFADCGAVCGVPCPRNRACFSSADCAEDSLCRPPFGSVVGANCSDGGCACRKKQAGGEVCSGLGADAECLSGRCRAMLGGGYRCESLKCSNGGTTADTAVGETDVDCGGTTCRAEARCAEGKKCLVATDCAGTLVCESNTCRQPTLEGNPCSSSAQCRGGKVCLTVGTQKRCQDPLAVDKACTANADCASGMCGGPTAATRKCVAAIPARDTSTTCYLAAQCPSGICLKPGKCTLPTTTDLKKNGTETGVDCGGPQPASQVPPLPPVPRCAAKMTCVDSSDCKAGLACSAGKICLTDVGGTCTAANACASGVCAGKVGARKCAPVSCRDGVQNRDETSVDCGGTACVAELGEAGRCGTGGFCEGASDCQSGNCGPNSACLPAKCNDGVRNGTEKAIDCGGTCGACPTGTPMPEADAAACASKLVGNVDPVTRVGRCAVVTCTDGTLNGLESDVVSAASECGRGCNLCEAARRCRVNEDCASGACILDRKTRIRQCAAPRPVDGIRNADESDVDCGGGSPNRCVAGRGCRGTADCSSGLLCMAVTESSRVCTSRTDPACSSGTFGVCSFPTCKDDVNPAANKKDKSETDVNCGGSTCGTRCGADKACVKGSDCASGRCSGGKCIGSTDTDGLRNGTETGIDCGMIMTASPVAGRSLCTVGDTCDSANDCFSGYCTRGVCAAGVCGNGETVSCGRGCRDVCAVEQPCLGDVDCVSGFCSNGRCSQVGCVISNLRVTSGVVDPGNQCRVCDPASNPVAWTSRAYAPTEAGRYCNDTKGATHSDQCVPTTTGQLVECRGTPVECVGAVDDCYENVSIPDGSLCANNDGCVLGQECAAGRCQWPLGASCSDDGGCPTDQVCAASGRCQWPVSGAPRVSACLTKLRVASTAAVCANEPQMVGCGNGVVEVGEACDDGNADGTDACNLRCQVASCGDGFVRKDVEQCDDGSLNADAGACRPANAAGATCLKAVCGDGVRRTDLTPGMAGYEACDDNNKLAGDGCSPTCGLESCGDGVVQASEECDDGNAFDGDGCTNDCRSAVCGDGRITVGIEDCDDGNEDNTDACVHIGSGDSVECVAASCGDGFVRKDVTDPKSRRYEECDDGNADNSDGCTTACRKPVCGDGYTGPGEQCDDGNKVGTDACTNVCRFPACGDGILQAGEACDDGNRVDADACTNLCKVAACGDGTWRQDDDSTEDCDDGNKVAGDGCGPTCVLDGPCVTNNGGCAPMAACSAVGTAVTCRCPTGFKAVNGGAACVDDDPPRDAPGGRVTVMDGGVAGAAILFWLDSPASDNVGVVRYRIAVGLVPTDGTDIPTPPASCSGASRFTTGYGYAVTGLEAGRNYAFRVCAVDAVGKLSAGITGWGTAGVGGGGATDTVPPVDGATITSASLAKSVYPYDYGIRLSWDASTDNSGSLAGYRIAFSEDAVPPEGCPGWQIQSHTADETTFELWGLKANTKYYVRVCASDGRNRSKGLVAVAWAGEPSGNDPVGCTFQKNPSVKSCQCRNYDYTAGKYVVGPCPTDRDLLPPVFDARAFISASGVADGIVVNLDTGYSATDNVGVVKFSLGMDKTCGAYGWDSVAVVGGTWDDRIVTANTTDWYGYQALYGSAYDLGFYDPTVSRSFYLCAFDEAGNVASISVNAAPQDMCLVSNGACRADLTCTNQTGSPEKCEDKLPPDLSVGLVTVTPQDEGIELALSDIISKATDNEGLKEFKVVYQAPYYDFSTDSDPCAYNGWSVATVAAGTTAITHASVDTRNWLLDSNYWTGEETYHDLNEDYSSTLWDPSKEVVFYFCAYDTNNNVAVRKITGRPKDMCTVNNGGCNALECRNINNKANPDSTTEECGDWTPPTFPAGAKITTEPIPDGIKLTLPLTATDNQGGAVVFTLEASQGSTASACGTYASYKWVLPAAGPSKTLVVDTNHWDIGSPYYPDGQNLYAYDPSQSWSFRLCAWDAYDLSSYSYQIGNSVSLAATDHSMDMCAVGNGGCDVLASYCRNTLNGRTWDEAASQWTGRETCGSCPTAQGLRNGKNLYFSFGGNGGGCIPTDWCDWGGSNGGCDPLATCTNRTVTNRSQVAFNNLSGFVTCTCPDGYATTDGGLTCIEIDECTSIDPPSCQEFSTCRNTEGSYACECDAEHPFGDGAPEGEGCTATPTTGARVGRVHSGALFEFSYVPRPSPNPAAYGATTFKMGSTYPSGVSVASDSYLYCSDMSDEQCETYSFGTEGDCNYVRDTWWTEGPQHDREINAAMLVARTETTQHQWWANVRETLIQDGPGSYSWLSTPATNPSNWAIEKPLGGQVPIYSSSRTFGVARLTRRLYPAESMGLYGALQFSNRLSEAAALPPAYSVGAAGRSSYAPPDFMADPESVEGNWKLLRDSSDRFFSNGGTGYRLPTEAEWEYVARAGNTGYRYGNADDVSWHYLNSGHEPHRTGLKLPNAWGLYDVLGNVAEWTTTHATENRPYCFGSPTCFYYVGGWGSCTYDGDKYSIDADIWDYEVERGLNSSYYAVDRPGNFRVRGGYFGYWAAFARFGYRGSTETADPGGLVEYGRLRAYGSANNGFRLVRNLCPQGKSWTVVDGSGSCR